MDARMQQTPHTSATLILYYTQDDLRPHERRQGPPNLSQRDHAATRTTATKPFQYGHTGAIGNPQGQHTVPPILSTHDGIGQPVRICVNKTAGKIVDAAF